MTRSALIVCLLCGLGFLVGAGRAGEHTSWPGLELPESGSDRERTESVGPAPGLGESVAGPGYPPLNLRIERGLDLFGPPRFTVVLSAPPATVARKGGGIVFVPASSIDLSFSVHGLRLRRDSSGEVPVTSGYAQADDGLAYVPTPARFVELTLNERFMDLSPLATVLRTVPVKAAPPVRHGLPAFRCLHEKRGLVLAADGNAAGAAARALVHGDVSVAGYEAAAGILLMPGQRYVLRVECEDRADAFYVRCGVSYRYVARLRRDVAAEAGDGAPLYVPAGGKSEEGDLAVHEDRVVADLSEGIPRADLDKLRRHMASLDETRPELPTNERGRLLVKVVAGDVRRPREVVSRAKLELFEQPTVVFMSATPENIREHLELAGHPEYTSTQGLCDLGELPMRKYLIIVSEAGYETAVVEARPSAEPVEVTLRPKGATSVAGAPAAVTGLTEPTGGRVTGRPEELQPIAEGGRYGFIDTAGQVVIPPQFSAVGRFSEQLAPAAQGGLWGYVDPTGAFRIPPAFLGAGRFSLGRARVVMQAGGQRRCGFVDASGAVVIAPQFDETGAGDFSEGLARVLMRGRWGYINTSGALVIRPKFEAAGDFSEGLAPVRTGNQWCYIDPSGQRVIELHGFTTVGAFSDGLAAVCRDGQWGYVDKSGRMVGEKLFRAAGTHSDGLAPVQVYDTPQLFGYVDQQVNLAVPPQFVSAGAFSGGLARVVLAGARPGGGRIGFIDVRGRMVLPPVFEKAADFQGGLAWVCRGGVWGYIDKAGRFVWTVDH